MLEKEILKKCKNRLDFYQSIGVIVHFDRYNSGKINVGGRWVQLSKSGTPDITVYIKHGNICAVLFIECKISGKKQSPDQIKFMMKFKDLTNVYYDVVTHEHQIDSRIESITNYSNNILNNIRF